MTGRNGSLGRDGDRGWFRGSSVAPVRLVDAFVEPMKDVVDAVADVATELHRSRTIAS